ncbi:MAG: hypothetical protein IIA67_01915 [Planctomycetes bacterium]|nr:hypothetical protein [Planctomycetota bacterium]
MAEKHKKQQTKGPWVHRFLVRLLTVALAVLVFWLLGFVINDIDTWPGPNLREMEARLLDADDLVQAEAIAIEIAQTHRTMAKKKGRQQILGDSTTNSQRTMNQLLAIRRLSLEKEVKPLQEEQTALADAETLFLANQKQYQLLNDDISRLNEQLDDLQERQRTLQQALDQQRQPVREEYYTLRRRHDMKLAASKLAVLVPLLVLAVLLIVRQRNSSYAVLVYALGIAVLTQVALVMHQYFPTRYFRYVLILVALGVVAWSLVYLIRLVASPGKDWLLKQYREAYETFFCPICEYPIRRGPLKYQFWTRRSIKRRANPSTPSSDADQPYTCPMCGTGLFEQCTKCDAIRHSLLPACMACGDEK